MARLPRLTAKEIIALVLERGFVETRQSGSHKIFRHPDGRRAVIPFHGNKSLYPSLIKSILKEAGIDPQESLK